MKFYSEELKERDHLEVRDVDGRQILKGKDKVVPVL
jgi:hypothetical protein